MAVAMNRNYLRAIPREWRTISRAFTALGDEHRQRILLTFESGERLNVGQIVEVSTLSRSAVSHHLKLLRDAGVLDSEKVGKEVFYWVNKPFLEDSIKAVLAYIREKA
jgi:DNA-binding transcriptional ArsR family regulator